VVVGVVKSGDGGRCVSVLVVDEAPPGVVRPAGGVVTDDGVMLTVTPTVC
jgi:hypothetical protein